MYVTTKGRTIFTEFAVESRNALARKQTDTVLTSAAILTQNPLTVVDF